MRNFPMMTTPTRMFRPLLSGSGPAVIPNLSVSVGHTSGLARNGHLFIDASHTTLIQGQLSTTILRSVTTDTR